MKSLKNLILAIIVLVIAVIAVLGSGLIPHIKLFSVLTGSMEPTIPQGSLIVVYPQDEYQIDDIITFEPPFEDGSVPLPITHRIVDVQFNETDQRTDYVTKGDANESEDAKTVTQSKVIGKVDGHIPSLGNLLNFVRTPVGAVIVVILPSAFIIFSEAGKIKENITIDVTKLKRKRTGDVEDYISKTE